VSGAKSAATGLALVVPFVWQFTTGLVADQKPLRSSL
jgi:hypothetical protein